MQQQQDLETWPADFCFPFHCETLGNKVKKSKSKPSSWEWGIETQRLVCTTCRYDPEVSQSKNHVAVQKSIGWGGLCWLFDGCSTSSSYWKTKTTISSDAHATWTLSSSSYSSLSKYITRNKAVVWFVLTPKDILPLEFRRAVQAKKSKDKRHILLLPISKRFYRDFIQLWRGIKT